MAQYISDEWVFTLNAPKGSTEDEADEVCTDFYNLVADNADQYKYICVQGEIGDSGNYHLQGYVWFNEIQTRKEVKKHFAQPTIHLEKRSKGSTCYAASDYVCHRGIHADKTCWDRFPLLEIGNLPLPPCQTKEEAIDRCKGWIDSMFDDPEFIAKDKLFWDDLKTKGLWD